jgi:hypothetical protein
MQMVNVAGCGTAGFTLQLYGIDNYADAQSQFTIRYCRFVDFVLHTNGERGGMRYGGIHVTII